MLKQILLLTPVYVTLFWSIALNAEKTKFSTPRLFLGKFMIFAFVIYLSHFLFFSPLPDLYIYFDPIYQYASLMVFPMYYIYFRLLTVDEKFSFKKHAIFLYAPTFFFILYCFGVIVTPLNEYKEWLYHQDIASTSFGIRYLNAVKMFMKICFLIQVIATVTGNYLLIRNHSEKAAQYYSDIEDSSVGKVKVLNYSMVITGIASLILGALGRHFFENEITGIAIASIVFSSMLYLIGWLGYKQKSLYPSSKIANEWEKHSDFEELSVGAQKIIIDKMLELFNERKVFLDSKLTILDVAQSVCTNRTYISTIINQHFNQNFCTFVNNYRLDEVEKVIRKHPEYTNQLLAENCGFGSVDSLKRAVMSKTNKKLQDWKNEVLSVR
jgi:AraC-like DNA-binding protein